MFLFLLWVPGSTESNLWPDFGNFRSPHPNFFLVISIFSNFRLMIYNSFLIGSILTWVLKSFQILHFRDTNIEAQVGKKDLLKTELIKAKQRL